jgi:hypothetical protein
MTDTVKRLKLEGVVDKKIAGLLGVVAGLSTVGSTQAATGPASNPSEALQASSYADLLAPIPNAAALVKAHDAAQEQLAEAAGEVQVAQVYYAPYPPPYVDYRHHHHHHHHRYYRRYSHNHHHHHHHAFVGLPGVGGMVIGR